ncbi:cyclodeaminase/cyclohydrolase family protein [Patescibacteria group bacterium]|nr:cyclodeaminase/cyclohydrolase family protein [Patescibacteria group bacterium]
MEIRKKRIGEFLNEVASDSPTPGGGAVAALSAAMAAGLVRMVADLTVDKKGYEKVTKKATGIGSAAKKLEKELLTLGDLDIAAYNSVVAAFKTKDKQKITKALHGAAEIPGKVAQKSLEVSRLAQKITKIGNKNALSDAKTAIYLAKAARLSALENVKINKRALARL